MDPWPQASPGSVTHRRASPVACAILAAATMLGGCAHLGAVQCDAGLRPMVAERLYFGTQRPGGTVSDAEWADFIAGSIAARFPAGFTTWDAAGGWRGADGLAVREASHVLEVLHPPGTAADAAIGATISDYKARFEQEAVLRVRVPACAAAR